MRRSDFEFDGVNLLYYNFNKISLNRGGILKIMIINVFNMR